MKRSLSIYSLAGLLCSLNVAAGSDPVAWTLMPATGFPATQAGQQSVVLYTLTNRLPFATSIVITHTTKGGSFSIHDECKNISLTPGGSCDVAVAYNPSFAQNSTFQLTYGYNNNRIPLPMLTAVGTPDQNTVLDGTITQISPTLYQNTSGNFVATYTNKSSTNLTDCTKFGALPSASFFTTTGVPATTNATNGTPACGTTLPAKQSCQLTGTVTPGSTSGQLNIMGPLSCMSGSTPVAVTPAASTFVKSKTGCEVHGSVGLVLPTSPHQYSDHVVSFIFTNDCSSAVTLSPVTVSATKGRATITTSTASPFNPFSGYPKCGSSLGVSQSCQVVASVIPQQAGALSIEAQLTDGLGHTVSAITGGQVQSPLYNHTVHFINQCPFPVWYGVANVPGNQDIMDPTPNPTPAAYELPAATSGVAPIVKSITFPGVYSGVFFPRTGCNTTINSGFLQCDTGDCVSSSTTGQCTNTGISPFTRAEQTFGSSTTQGIYDIGIINGASVPTEIKGLGPMSSQYASPAQPFICTGAGAPIQPSDPNFNPQYGAPPPALPPLPAPQTPLGYCPWTYTPPASMSSAANFVADIVGGTSSCATLGCAADPGTVCGLGFSGAPSAQTVVSGCGTLVGYWTINQYCTYANSDFSGATPNPNTTFNCTMAITNYSPTNTYPAGTLVSDLYTCNNGISSSCYSNGAVSTCCGVQNWNAPSNGLPYITWQDSQSFNSNVDWTNQLSGLPISALSAITWLKQACPTAYSYPHDDQASSFTCNSSDANQQNSVAMDFDVVFCPGGLTGGVSP
jgi:hypothetical protein